VTFAGVVEWGYRRDFVDQLPQLSRRHYKAMQSPEAVWSGTSPLLGEVKFLEWSRADGLRHATFAQVRAQPST
jgi:hypothetical protein